MVANISNAIAAYANAGRIAAPGGASASTGAAGGGSFADMLKQAAGDATDSLRQGEAASMEAVSGKVDLTKVTQAVNNAEVTLQAVIAVRDRVISAYQDISKMPI
jgi:flagellar hook-basal body complex protein FliE